MVLQSASMSIQCRCCSLDAYGVRMLALLSGPARQKGRHVAILSIRTLGDPVLREPAAQVDPKKESLDELVKNLTETMRSAPGVGLAANQIGVLKAVFVFDMEDGLRAFANPRIVWQSEEVEEEEEGCLSLPDVRIPIKRPTRIKVELTDMSGNVRVVEAEGLLARVLQHEVDHLQGRLLLDRASRADRKRAIKEMSQPRLAGEMRDRT